MMVDETQQRIVNEIANKCGLLTEKHYAFLSSDNKAFRKGILYRGLCSTTFLDLLGVFGCS